jgi:hypothetical protein
MELGDFVFFSAYALAGLVPSLSSFFLTLLEYYGLQLQHLSPNSITLVAIFVHFCEIFMGVRPLMRFFQRFFIMKVVSQHPLLIGGYYFQRRTQGLSRCIAPISPGRWESWRDDWALGQADAHDRLTLPVVTPTLDPVLDQIQYPLPRVGIQPRARSDPVPGREWPDLTDVVA